MIDDPGVGTYILGDWRFGSQGVDVAVHKWWDDNQTFTRHFIVSAVGATGVWDGELTLTLREIEDVHAARPSLLVVDDEYERNRQRKNIAEYLVEQAKRQLPRS